MVYTIFVPLVCGELFLRIFYFLEVYSISAKTTQTNLTNEDIKVKEVRVVGEDGEQLGIMDTAVALQKAYDQGVDLVMMAPNAVPPVCRIMDYGKFRFEKEKREKESRKKQQVAEVKEVQLSCRIDTHDFETKANRAIGFLKRGDKVKVIVRFKGREMSHLEIGREMLERFETYCSEFGVVDKKPNLEGRFMTMFISPVKSAPAKAAAKEAPANEE